MDENDYFQKITESIYDDNEIVTCSILSNKLKIKVQDAQNILDKYVENADVPEQNDLSWMYMITGINENNGGFTILILNQEELEKNRNSLKSVISQHVYSVHRKGDIDSVTLANAEPFAEHKIRNQPLQGFIVSENAVKRKLKQIVTTNGIKQENKTENKDGILEKKSCVSKPKKNGIESFCTKGESTSFTPKPAVSGKMQQKNMMANFISKSFTKPKENGNNLVKRQDIEVNTNVGDNKDGGDIDENAVNEIMDVDDQLDEKEDKVIVNKNENISKTKEDTKQSNKSKKRKSQSKSSQLSKKRKRIIEQNNSDSDIFGSSESEIEVNPDIYLSDDSLEPSPPVLPTKARIKKQVTEEFMDEEGYLHTIQKNIMVSDDEEEAFKEQKPLNTVTTKSVEKPTVKIKDAPPSKKETSHKNGKGKAAAKTNKAQSSITNFFKKI